MKNLTTSDETLQIPPLEEIVETLLVEAGCAATLPTDEGRLLEFLELRQMSFDFMSDPELRPKQGPKKDIRAVLSLNHRLVVTQPGLNAKKRRFGVLHEVGHFINNEHRQKLFYDTDETLNWWTRVRIEREANEVAAQLVFQGNRFTEEALQRTLSARTAIDLAPKYDASFESALRRYTERHTVPCALVVFDKIPSKGLDEFEEPDYKLQYTITSAPFRKNYFSGLQTSETAIPQSELLPAGHLGIHNILERELVVQGDGSEWNFETEVFSNSYRVFQFIVREAK